MAKRVSQQSSWSDRVNPKGGVRWITWQQAFGLSSSDLSLPLHWNGEVQQRDEQGL